MEALILSVFEAGALSEKTTSGKLLLKIQQVKVANEDGGARVLYPSQTDLNIENSKLQVIIADKE